jgi:hypothetical protein
MAARVVVSARADARKCKIGGSAGLREARDRNAFENCCTAKSKTSEYRQFALTAAAP